MTDRKTITNHPTEIFLLTCVKSYDIFLEYINLYRNTVSMATLNPCESDFSWYLIKKKKEKEIKWWVSDPRSTSPCCLVVNAEAQQDSQAPGWTTRVQAP